MAVTVAVALTVAVLCIHADAGQRYNYHHYVDDMLSLDVLKQYGVWKGAWYLYHTISGRWYSFLLSLFFTPALTQSWGMAVYYLLSAAVIIASLSFLLRQWWLFRWNIQLSVSQSITISAMLYSSFVLFAFDKRYEFWYWFSATVVYLFSLVQIMLLSAIAIKPTHTFLQRLMMFALALPLGLMAETHAIAMLCILAGLAFSRYSKNQSINAWQITNGMAMLCIVAGMAANYFSDGNAAKLNITHTELFSVVSLQRAASVWVNDLLFKWEFVSIRFLPHLQIPAILLRVFAVLIAGTWLQWYISAAQLKSNSPEPPTFNWNILLFGVAMLLLTYFISAWLYANMADRIVDRCKMFGYAMLFWTFADAAIATTLNKTALHKARRLLQK